MSLAEDYANGGQLTEELALAKLDVAAHMRRAQRIRLAETEGTLGEDTVLPAVLHAYRYEELPDGSVLTFWADEKTSTSVDEPINVNMKAFPNMAKASMWDPRIEHSEWVVGASPDFEVDTAEEGLVG